MKEKTQIERLWAPWRLEHIQKHAEKAKDSPCVFCELAKMPCNEESLKLYESKHCYIVMNRFPYNPNHLLVIPNKHLGMLPELNKEVWTDLSDCLKATTDLLMDKIKPHGINVGLNMGKAGGASIAEHLHFHILPRWEGDTNFMPLLAETRSLPVHNLTVFETLKKHFADFKKFLP
jgi:ATP adenylyltransferase